MKLKSDVIKKTLAQNSSWYVGLFRDTDQAEVSQQLSDIKNWHRGTKFKLVNIEKRLYEMSLDEFAESSEKVDTLDSQPLTPDCVVRHFYFLHGDMECLVISDASDEKILQIYWHQD